MNRLKLFAAAVIAVFTAGCDSGNIYPKENKPVGTGANVTAEFSFINVEAFPANYKVIFGTFKNDSPYPVSSIRIQKPAEDAPVTVTLTDIPEQTDYLGLYLVQEYGGMQIYPFYTYRPESVLTEDIALPAKVIDLAAFGRVQKQVFSQCIQCHGGSGSAAKGLYLTDEKSYAALYEIYTKNDAAKMYVEPGEPGKSYLMEVLKGEALEEVHSTLSSLKEDDITLAERWIAAGAHNN